MTQAKTDDSDEAAAARSYLTAGEYFCATVLGERAAANNEFTLKTLTLDYVHTLCVCVCVYLN